MFELTKKMERSLTDIASWVSTACSELGYQAVRDDWGFEDEVAKLRKRGVEDIGGALADQIYNDVGYMADMIGDRLYDVLLEHGIEFNDETWSTIVDAFTDRWMRHLPSLKDELKK